MSIASIRRLLHLARSLTQARDKYNRLACGFQQNLDCVDSQSTNPSVDTFVSSVSVSQQFHYFHR